MTACIPQKNVPFPQICISFWEQKQEKRAGICSDKDVISIEPKRFLQHRPSITPRSRPPLKPSHLVLQSFAGTNDTNCKIVKFSC